MRLVLDTNTAVSGLLWDGPPCRLIEAAEAGAIEIISSIELLTEFRNVIGRTKFSGQLALRAFSSAGVFSDYLALVTIVAPALITPTIMRDLADDAVLEAALGGRADLIVSGDAHLLNLKSFQRIDIVTAAMAVGRVTP